MNIDFLLYHTTVGSNRQNTYLIFKYLFAIKYLIEYYILKSLNIKHVNRVVSDMLKYPKLKEVFVDHFKLSVSDDNTFVYFEIDIPEEIRNSSERMQLLAYAESVVVEMLRPNYNVSANSYILSKTFSTIAAVEHTNLIFVIIEYKYFAKFLALSKHLISLQIATAIQISILIFTIIYFLI